MWVSSWDQPDSERKIVTCQGKATVDIIAKKPNYIGFWEVDATHTTPAFQLLFLRMLGNRFALYLRKNPESHTYRACIFGKKENIELFLAGKLLTDLERCIPALARGIQMLEDPATCETLSRLNRKQEQLNNDIGNLVELAAATRADGLDEKKVDPKWTRRATKVVNNAYVKLH